MFEQSFHNVLASVYLHILHHTVHYCIMLLNQNPETLHEEVTHERDFNHPSAVCLQQKWIFPCVMRYGRHLQ